MWVQSLQQKSSNDGTATDPGERLGMGHGNDSVLEDPWLEGSRDTRILERNEIGKDTRQETNT